MFYCNPCASENNWPETMFRSKGMCECCAKPNQSCNDTPSRHLPDVQVKCTISKRKS